MDAPQLRLRESPRIAVEARARLRFAGAGAPLDAAALDLSVDRVVAVVANQNQNIPIGEVYQGDRALLLRSQGQYQNLEQIANTVVLTKNGVPVCLRDIAEVRD